MTRTRVGLLSTRGHPLLGGLVERLSAVPAVELFLILDNKDFTEKDRRRFEERTEGAFPVRPVNLDSYRWTTVSDHNGEDALTFICGQNIDLLVNAGTPRRLTAGLLARPRIGVLNVHPGILPKYRGINCCEWAIYNDDPVGVSAHFMDEGLDSGPIIFTRTLEVKPGQTYSQVRVGLYRLWIETCSEAMTEVLDRGLTPAALSPQPDFPVFKPIPDALFFEVKEKLARGAYRCAR